MTELIYYLSNFGAFFIVGITLWHARSERARLVFFGTSMVYGFLLEKASIVLFRMHSYPAEEFFLYLFDVPVSVPLAWGVIMYASLTAGRYVGLQRRRLPVFAGLFALHIDLAIDATAIRIPFWTWYLPGILFDVPTVNFVGWYSVPLLFTGFFLHLEGKTENYALVGLISLLASTTLLMAIIGMWLRFVSPSAIVEVLIFGTIIIASLAYLTRVEVQPGLYLDGFPVETFLSVLLIHLFYIQTILYYGYHRNLPILLYVSIAMLLIGIGVHSLPRLMVVRGSRLERGSGRRI